MLRDLNWTPIGNKIQVLNDTRDLGTHLNALTTLRGTTLTQRLHDTSDQIHRQRHLPLSKPHRHLVATTKYLPKALYGCETQPVNEGALIHFRASLAIALGNRTTSRSLDTTFTVASLGKGIDIDPCVQIIVRRIRLLRRFFYQHDITT